ncbi:MAG: hypothetical protein A3F72_00770 [Bacteroidetes bacterium RIFCSPLOWO2_12_FULL_35_15]|nr:MAG: hypothetical protein A3F72_00770 [Bacteroidetes bacterium RIFCSPLOWO2_12_FULL_35_15]
MKNIYTSLTVFFLIFTSAFAQIPNNGFENWTTIGNGMKPTGWWSSNDSVNQTNSYFPISRSADHYPITIGNYSIRLENKPSLGDWSARGIAWTGDWNGMDYPTFPINGHPTLLYGYFKYQPQNNDTMDIHIRLYKNGIDVAGGKFASGMLTNTWTAFSIPISSYTDADSARIMIVAWNVDQVGFDPLGNSVLYVDNLSLDSLIVPGISENIYLNPTVFFPNPASKNVRINVANNSEQNKLEIFNVLGQCVFVKQISFETEITLDITEYPEGMYFVNLTSGNDLTFCRKLIIAR